MCYYNGIKIPLDSIIRLKDFEKKITVNDLFSLSVVNGFDYGQYPVLKKTNENDFEITWMEWGFLPPYVFTREKANQFRLGYKKPDGSWQPPFTTLNAKGEELLLPNKMFREAALLRRCLVLSSGFYEWRHVHPISRRTGKPLKTAEKYPYHITLKGKEYFFMAGLWQPWKDHETGEYVETFAIVTTVANALMEQVHNSRKRMPLILTEEMACEWLLGKPDEKRIAEISTFQYDAAGMHAITIAKNFRDSARPDAAFDYEGLPSLNS